MVIALGSSDYFAREVWFLVVFFLISLALSVVQRITISRDVIIIAGLLLILTVANIALFQFFSYWTTLGAFIRFILPFLMLSVIGFDYPRYYIVIMRALTIISFLFYLPSIIITDFAESLLIIPETLNTDPVQGLHFIIYTIEFDKALGINILRNAGPCGEPGEFAGYLIIAIIFKTIISNKIWTRDNILFFLGLISTFSTMGYLALFVLLISYFLVNRSRRVIIWIPILVFIIYQAYYRLDFMHRKIYAETEILIESGLENVERTGRIPNLWNNLQDSFEYPIFGKGRNYATRYEDYESMEAYQFSASLFDLAADWGWPFFIIYFLLILNSFKTFCRMYGVNPNLSYFLILVLFILYTSQNFQYQTAFIALLYLKGLFTRSFSFSRIVNVYRK